MSLFLAFVLKHWRWVALAAFLAAVAGASLYRGYQWGKSDGDAEVRAIKAALAEAQAEEAIHAAQLAQGQAEVTTKVITEYVDRVKVIREKGETITKLVPVYVPLLELPGSWRVLHDAAATGQVPDPARTADAPGTDTQVLAATVSDNYATCHANAEQLTKLQDWVLEQSRLWQTSANSSGG